MSAEGNASLEQIRYRGPDSTGTWVSRGGRVALGHVRLEINDLTSGSQPPHSTDGTLHAVANGEIYDYEELRHEMEGKLQYKFQGTSDSELVLALYKYYGLSISPRFEESSPFVCMTKTENCLWPSEIAMSSSRSSGTSKMADCLWPLK